MIRKELFGGREDGKSVQLPEHLPQVLEVPSVNFNIDIELEFGDPTKPLPLFVTSTYILDSEGTYKAKELR